MRWKWLPNITHVTFLTEILYRIKNIQLNKLRIDFQFVRTKNSRTILGILMILIACYIPDTYALLTLISPVFSVIFLCTRNVTSDLNAEGETAHVPPLNDFVPNDNKLISNLLLFTFNIHVISVVSFSKHNYDYQHVKLTRKRVEENKSEGKHWGYEALHQI